MINKRYENVVFSFFMALIMSCIMSLVITIFNIGLVDNIIFIWLKAWLFAFSVAFPTVTLIAPFVKKLEALVITSK